MATPLLTFWDKADTDNWHHHYMSLTPFNSFPFICHRITGNQPFCSAISWSITRVLYDGTHFFLSRTHYGFDHCISTCVHISSMNEGCCTVRAWPAVYHAQRLAASFQHRCTHQTLGQELLYAECYVGEVFSAVQQGSFRTQPAAAQHLHRHITSKHQSNSNSFKLSRLTAPMFLYKSSTLAFSLGYSAVFITMSLQLTTLRNTKTVVL